MFLCCFALRKALLFAVDGEEVGDEEVAGRGRQEKEEGAG